MHFNAAFYSVVLAKMKICVMLIGQNAHCHTNAVVAQNA